MDKCLSHLKTYYSGNCENYMCTWSIPNVSSINKLYFATEIFKMQNGYSYNPRLIVSQDKITFSIATDSENLKCSASVFIGSETLLFTNSLNQRTRYEREEYRHLNCHYDLITLSSEEECFQKLKQYPNETLVFICRIKYGKNYLHTSSEEAVKVDTLYNLKTLAATLKNSSEDLLKEKVTLRVGDETETVSKAVLCARSSVFAKMFQNDMRELKNNVINIIDIKMSVLKAFVSFLFAGKLPKYDLDFICDLYYAADKYDIEDLRQLCGDLILPQIAEENIIRVMKLAYSHNDIRLKSTVLAWIATNIETWVFTNEWKNLVMDEPKIAVEVLEFFDF